MLLEWRYRRHIIIIITELCVVFCRLPAVPGHDVPIDHADNTDRRPEQRATVRLPAEYSPPVERRHGQPPEEHPVGYRHDEVVRPRRRYVSDTLIFVCFKFYNF